MRLLVTQPTGSNPTDRSPTPRRGGPVVKWLKLAGRLGLGGIARLCPYRTVMERMRSPTVKDDGQCRDDGGI